MWKFIALIALECFALDMQGQAGSSYDFSTRTTLVVVPTQVMTAKGQPIYGLQAADFDLTDNGVRQQVHLNQAADQSGISLVVLVQCSGGAALAATKMSGLKTMIESVVGDAPHEIAVFTYSSISTILTNFTSESELVSSGLSEIKPCRDDGVATLDAVSSAAHLLAGRPNHFRHAILLISETRDHGSREKPQDVMALLGQTNTVVESVSFSPGRDQVTHDLQHDNDKPTNWIPLFAMAVNAMRKNAASELSELSGGEYANFATQRGFDQALMRISNQIHNYYELSFQPNAQTQIGFHSLDTKVIPYPDAVVKSRQVYWFSTQRSATNIP
jgi:VWFA-related protein